MGRKGKVNTLGRSLIKDRFGHSARQRKVDNDSMLHTTEIQDGYDWGRLNLQSVTEESSFQEFLRTAELAGTEFQAEKLNITFVNPKSNVGYLTKLEENALQKKHIDMKKLLKIPRRPKWNSETTAENLQRAESESFLEWRRDLALLQENDGLFLTPYEKNLEFWRQLWRVVERSDVVVQIVDARNPLLFRNEDLEQYVKELDAHKMNMVLVNKADYLTEEQRQAWANFFDKERVQLAFFSAVMADEELRTIDEIEDTNTNTTEKALNVEEIHETAEQLSKSLDKTEEQLFNIEKCLQKMYIKSVHNTKILSRLELIALLKSMYRGPKHTKGVTTIGLVGYPNVGKSSTINALINKKKVSVSATPGKTKHFQTIFLDEDLLLCDCPGLVMPSFVLTKADMILNGILPIDQMRDHIPPVNVLCTRIPKYVLEDKYGIIIAKPSEGEDSKRPPYAEELLLAYGYNRGFMTANGQPDQARSARFVLKDYVKGKLLYCQAPPDVEQKEYHKFNPRTTREIKEHVLPQSHQRALRIIKPASSQDIDTQFFLNNDNKIHIKGRSNFPHIRDSSEPCGVFNPPQNVSRTTFTEKPWRHTKKEKREKLRKKFAHLDQH